MMPAGGPRIGRLHVTPAGMDGSEANGADGAIRLGILKQLGHGVPPHNEALPGIYNRDVLQGGEMVLDYGTGSGVLGIGALKLEQATSQQWT